MVIDEHTINANLLKQGSTVLDAGCRGFNFSKTLSDMGCKVLAIDAAPLEAPQGIKFMQRVITTNSLVPSLRFYDFGNGTGSYSEEVGTEPSECKVTEVQTYVIRPFWDLIKLDIEGAECAVLMNMKTPLAHQISVEFHMHTCSWQTEEYIQSIFKHVSQWYEIIGAVKEQRHGCGENLWDVCMILK